MKISKYFTLHEVLFLPKWNRVATKQDGLTVEIIHNLKDLCLKVDRIRDLLGKPIIVHVAFRPIAYNQLIKGAPQSAHINGKAIDFHVDGMTCDDVKKFILDNKLLDALDLRMEDNGVGAPWIHLDTNPVINSRFFKP